MSFSDDDDLRLFESLVNPELARRILRIKNNDPEVTSFMPSSLGDDLNERALMRLGCILGQNTHVKELMICFNLDVIGLCDGLQHNQCIEKLSLIGINLQGSAQMNALAPFLSNNPSLKDIILRNCNIGSAGINILSTALLNRSEDTLGTLDLSNNHFGDIDLDQLVLALNKNKNLLTLILYGNGIGPRGCTSLAKLLSNREYLVDLDLENNSIDNESTIILADSLAKNTKLEQLEELNLRGNNAITSEGWSAMLKLVCNSSSINTIMKSNHTLISLSSVGSLLGDSNTRIENSLGNLLDASLRMNNGLNKTSVVRRKIFWSHARGDLNLGDSSIVAGAMPRILAWIGLCSNNPNANLIQYHENPLPKAQLGAIRLASIYRILRSTPDLLFNACSKERLRRTRILDENKDLRDENKELRDENKKLRDENKRLKTMLRAETSSTGGT